MTFRRYHKRIELWDRHSALWDWRISRRENNNLKGNLTKAILVQNCHAVYVLSQN